MNSLETEIIENVSVFSNANHPVYWANFTISHSINDMVLVPPPNLPRHPIFTMVLQPL